MFLLVSGVLAVLGRAAPWLNTALCVVLALMIGVQLVALLGCGARVRRWTSAAPGSGAMMTGTNETTARSCFSDDVLVAAVANEIK